MIGVFTVLVSGWLAVCSWGAAAPPPVAPGDEAKTSHGVIIGDRTKKDVVTADGILVGD